MNLLVIQSLILKFLEDFRINLGMIYFSDIRYKHNQISWFDKKYIALKKPNLSSFKRSIRVHKYSLSRILKQSI